jgi:hypothetical protein
VNKQLQPGLILVPHLRAKAYLGVISPLLVAAHTVAPDQLNGTPRVRRIQAVVIRHYLLAFRVSKYLKHNIILLFITITTKVKGSRILYQNQHYCYQWRRTKRYNHRSAHSFIRFFFVINLSFFNGFYIKLYSKFIKTAKKCDKNYNIKK